MVKINLFQNGDRYEGWLKDGRPHGQGIFKQGRLGPGGHNASVYLGEWVNGAKSGYGVADDIVSAEKYMGMWCNDLKSGRGCVVTLDGVYYEGNFSHGKMTGRLDSPIKFSLCTVFISKLLQICHWNMSKSLKRTLNFRQKIVNLYAISLFFLLLILNLASS